MSSTRTRRLPTSSPSTNSVRSVYVPPFLRLIPLMSCGAPGKPRRRSIRLSKCHIRRALAGRPAAPPHSAHVAAIRTRRRACRHPGGTRDERRGRHARVLCSYCGCRESGWRCAHCERNCAARSDAGAVAQTGMGSVGLRAKFNGGVGDDGGCSRVRCNMKGGMYYDAGIHNTIIGRCKICLQVPLLNPK